MHLQPLTEIHLQSHYPGENNGSITVIYTFSAIGFVIILIAAINFMNLSTVRSLKRAREVGMRKVLGGQRINLIVQLLIESVAVVFLSALVAVLIAYLMLNFFNELIGTRLSLRTVVTGTNLFLLFSFILLLGLISGTYPAFFLSGYKPALVLKGKFAMHTGSIRLRKALVITQFGVGFVVLVGTFIVKSQIGFMLNKDLGYVKDNVVTIELPADSVGVDRVRDEILNIPHVVAASKMSESFNNVQGWLVPWYEGAPPQNDFSVTRLHTDNYFKDVVGLDLVAGRFFNEDFRGDSLSYVLNETTVKQLGWKNEEAIGKAFGSEERPGKVIGVVKDFHFRHLATPIAPFVFFPPSRRVDRYEKGRIAVRIEAKHSAEVIKAMNDKWNILVPEWPFNYSYLAMDVSQQYQAELRLSKLTRVFSGLAIFISALGLFGLASFSIQQRIKEIGIRKVLGADQKSLLTITTKDFIILVLIGMGMGVPVAYIGAIQWLNDYAYRVDISVAPFIIAFVASLLIAIVTVSSVAFKALSANPVDSLRQE
jgi:putative ABC transport system permease protein